jgi:lipopolysaccharide heptosyltransferase I
VVFAPSNILLIRPSALGDVARSVPALASVRRAMPDARIDWLVEQGFEEIIAHHPALSNVVSFPKKAIKAAMRRLRFGPLLEFRRSLRAARYDCVIDLQGLARSAAMAYATGAPRRVGLANARELGWLAYTLRVEADLEMHSVDRMLAIIDGMGIEPVKDMRLFPPPAAREWLAAQPWAKQPYAVLAPTSRWPAKQWPAARFAALASSLRVMGLTIVIVGGRGEHAQCGPLLELAARDSGIIDLIGGTGIGQLMATIERSSLVVANDSAALHIATGLSRPLVALYGPTRVHRVGPYGRDADVIQHLHDDDTFDHKAAASVRMMERIGVEEVIDAATRRLQSAPR